MRYRSRSRFRVYFLAYLMLTFVAPLLTSVPLIATVAIMNNWWSAIPVMDYWIGYQIGMVSTGLGGLAFLACLAIYLFVEWIWG